MFILFDLGAEIWGIIRKFLLLLDSIGLTFIDDAYGLIMGAATAFNGTEIAKLAGEISQSCYIIIGIFALFRIALSLVNAMINPDKLNDKQEGFGSMISRLIITVVLFVAVPIVFDMSRDLQAEIMDNNYISKILIGKDLIPKEGSESDENPGKQIKDIAVRALIKPDERIAKATDSGYEAINECVGEPSCEGAIEAWNADVSYNTLSIFIGNYVEQDDENIYVYSYTPIITMIVGIFITYVLLSFAIDIAIRTVELVVLEVLSPLFIVTYIDPKQGSKGTFNRWLSACGKSYLSLFIRIAIVCLMLLLISKLDSLFKIGSDSGVFLKLLMLIAILIFAKKAPKWIGNIIGMDGEGLGGLGIGKKVKEGISPLNNKVTRGAAAIGTAAVGNRIANARKRHELKKNSGEYNKLGFMHRDKKRNLRENGIIDKDGNRLTGHKAVSYYKKDNGLRRDQRFGKNVVGLGSAVASGIKVSGEAKGVLSAVKGGINASGNYNTKYTQMGPGMVGKAKEKIQGVKDSIEQGLYGSQLERYQTADRLKKEKQFREVYNENNAKKAGIDISELKLSFGQIKGLGGTDLQDMLARNYAYAAGVTKEEYNNLSPAEKQNYANNCVSILNPTGLESLAKTFTQVVQSSFGDYQNNNNYINQLAGSIASMQSSLEKFGVIRVNEKNLDISKKSIEEIGKEYEESQKKLKKAEKVASETSKEDEKYEAAQNELVKAKNEFEVIQNAFAIKNQLKSSTNELINCQEQKKTLGTIINNIGKEYSVNSEGKLELKDDSAKYNTDSAKTSYLEKKIKEYEDIINLNKQKDEKK